MFRRPAGALRQIRPFTTPSNLEGLQTGVLSSLSLRHNSTFSSELGVRTDHPPDSAGIKSQILSSNSNSNPQPQKDDNDWVVEISDREWEVRTGRAIDILRETLPHFFETGLITSVDRATGEPKKIPTSALPGMTLPAVKVIPGLNPSTTKEMELESIYSPKVRLSYTPPAQLPAPFPKTLSVEGIPLYLASSVFIRHTLSALYTDLDVTLHKVVVNTPKTKPNLSTPGESGSSEPGTAEEAERDKLGLSRKKNREKSLFIGLRVLGVSRVSGAEGQWQVNSTYTFSPTSGLIHVHTINSIQPAPHLTVYDALRMSLGNVFGYGGPNSEGSQRSPGGAAPAACTGKGDGCKGESQKGASNG
ncbi:hypothetical protein D9758_007296 [Tetrapyrgos nigripes]|uniref:Uncharacterized protein n=1 Tax=Tetrapyrgos nigripes TaxID=182062 RepID=A0A8H5LLN3_9AGAR|nr:hypothetical protein D9758_007296 [Tetrapyrgos nigripes]